MSLTLPTGSSDDDIYIGFWTNYSSGTFLGATLTLSQQNGNLLLAFLALFIGASGRALWTIIRFILHTSLSTTVPRDAVYHQQQAVLRNTPLAHDAAIDLLRASFVWHQRTHSVRRRVLPVALLAAMISALSVAASITSSKALLTATNEALISGRLCGKLVSNNVSNNTTLSFSVSDTTSYFNRKGVESFAHVTQCGHGSTERLAESCGAFVKSSLPFTSDKNASCPFSEEMCKSSTRNLLLDSGDIDSLSHLGLNTGPRFIMRHQSHCAPLNTQNLTEMTESQTGERHLTYRYGFGPEDFFTYRLKPDGEKPIPGVTNGDYKVSVIRDDESDTFIPQLRSSNGYVSLIFLDASEVLTFNETDDPWFEGTPLMYSNHSSDSLSTKTPGVIGCITRRFYCNPSLPAGAACVNGFAHNTLETLPQIWNDSQDLSVIRPILSTLSPNYLDIWYYLRSVPTLLSRNTIMAGMQMDILPDDRWQAEREHLFRASLVSIQSTMTDYARGFWLGMPGLCSNGMQCWKNCRSQKVRSSRHFSFSVLALVTILLLGSLIMISSAFVERINEIGRHIFTRRSARNQTYAQVEWRTNSTLQLQRVAHENLGLGDWAKTDKAIPVTDSRVTLGVLDISNTKHARLVRPGLGLKDLHVTENDADAVAGPRYTRLSSVDQSC